MEDALSIAPVGSPDQEENIRFRRGNFFGVVFRQLKGIGFEDFGSGAQAGLSGGLGRQLRHQTGGHHPQAAGSGGAGIPVSKNQGARLCFQQGQGIGKPLGHIRLHRGVGGSSAQQLFSVQIYGSDFGICTAEIN